MPIPPGVAELLRVLGAPDKISDPEALTQVLRQHARVLKVSQSLLPRAIGLVHGLAEEARRRGHKLAMSRKRINRGLFVQIRGRQCAVTITEDHDQVPHVPTAEERRQQRHSFSWQRASPEYDLVPSGRLRRAQAGPGSRPRGSLARVLRAAEAGLPQTISRR